jgi:hypothetical protein
MAPDAIIKFLQNGGILAAMVLFSYAAHKGYIILGTSHARELALKDEIIKLKDDAVQSLTKDRDYWRQNAWDAKEVAKRTTRVMERQASGDTSGFPSESSRDIS